MKQKTLALWIIVIRYCNRRRTKLDACVRVSKSIFRNQRDEGNKKRVDHQRTPAGLSLLRTQRYQTSRY